MGEGGIRRNDRCGRGTGDRRRWWRRVVCEEEHARPCVAPGRRHEDGLRRCRVEIAGETRVRRRRRNAAAHHQSARAIGQRRGAFHGDDSRRKRRRVPRHRWIARAGIGTIVELGQEPRKPSIERRSVVARDRLPDPRHRRDELSEVSTKSKSEIVFDRLQERLGHRHPRDRHRALRADRARAGSPPREAPDEAPTCVATGKEP